MQKMYGTSMARQIADAISVYESQTGGHLDGDRAEQSRLTWNWRTIVGIAVASEVRFFDALSRGANRR